MASQQDSSPFQAGEVKGRAEETTGRVIEKGREAAETAMGKARTRQIKDKVAEKTGSFLQETADAAREKAARAESAARETVQSGEEKTSSFLQQTGERMMGGAAAGAADAVKNTLGLGAGKEDSH